MSSYVAFRNGGGQTDEQGALKFLAHLFRPGVATGWAVTQRGSGANMSVDVALGGAAIPTVAGTYDYYGWTDATTNVTVSTANATNPRIDTLVAWIDLSVLVSANTNNIGALKFTAVAGTAAASPVAPSTSQIQTAIGASNPYIVGPNIAVAANATSIVTGNLTGAFLPMALAMPYLYGGSNNTKGHLVPNVADDTVALLNAVQTLIGKSLSWTGNAATGNVVTNPYKFSVYRAAAQTIPATSTVKVQFDTKAFDTSSNYDNTTNFRFTATVAGTYSLQSTIAVSGAAGKTYIAIMYKNGVEFKRGSQLVNGAAAGDVTLIVGDPAVLLAANDYIEIFFFNGDVGSNGLQVGANRTYFSGYLVSHL